MCSQHHIYGILMLRANEDLRDRSITQNRRWILCSHNHRSIAQYSKMDRWTVDRQSVRRARQVPGTLPALTNFESSTARSIDCCANKGCIGSAAVSTDRADQSLAPNITNIRQRQAGNRCLSPCLHSKSGMVDFGSNCITRAIAVGYQDILLLILDNQSSCLPFLS